MHELGHNFWRRHGGDVTAPNCKPNYLSVMSYLFQLNGFVDDNGLPHLDYSREVALPLDETFLFDGALPASYRTAWYAPASPGTLFNQLGVTPAKKYCSGAKFPTPLPPNWVPMVRVDGPAISDPIDWNTDGFFGGASAQDINFDGLLNGQ